MKQKGQRGKKGKKQKATNKKWALNMPSPNKKAQRQKACEEGIKD